MAGRLPDRVVTGPLAHLLAGVLDWGVLLGRLARRRLRPRGSRA